MLLEKKCKHLKMLLPIAESLSSECVLGSGGRQAGTVVTIVSVLSWGMGL